MRQTEIAIIGCGFVADYYLTTLKEYPHIKIIGLYDRIIERAQLLAKTYGHPVFYTLNELLQSSCSIVLNLTNPGSHFELNRACLLAKKHVYSEKPLAMNFEHARELVELANKNGVFIVSAPCSLLGEQAQTLMKAVREEIVGKIWLVYAEMDDGPVHLMNPHEWRSISGVPWPVEDEFDVGCTLEHAGYIIPWLVAMFGSVISITAHASVRIQDKLITSSRGRECTPDFSVSILKFSTGVEARLSCGIVAAHDHKIKFYGERGTLSVDECWHYGEPVRMIRYSKIGFKAEKYRWIRNSYFLSFLFGLTSQKLDFVKKPCRKFAFKKDYMDYARGIVDLADAIASQSEPTLTPQFCLHVNEVVLAIQESVGGRVYKPYSRVSIDH